MAASALDAFEESVASVPATLDRVTTDEFRAALRPHLTTPSVGVELPYDDVSLADLPVTLSPGPDEIQAAHTGVTPVTLAIADYGSVVVGDRGDGSEPVSLFVETHVAVVRASDVVQSMSDAIGELGDEVRDGLTSAIIATGPSATADMGELVHGVHGPRDVHVLVLTDQ